MTLARIKNHFVNWRDWEPNAIVVKELRQAVRSWTVTGMLLLFLVVLFLISISFLVSQSFNTAQNLHLGGTLFATFAGILSAASILFIPLYLGARIAAERVESNLDLLYVSTLSPARIIFGKFLCGAYIALLFFSACLPFMAFTNLLRGVDLPTIFFSMLVLYLLVCAANQLNIFLACLPIGRPLKILLALVSLIFSFFIVARLSLNALMFSGRGYGSMMFSGVFWEGVLIAFAIGAALTGLFFVLSVTLISPPSANRAFLPRVYITVLWIASLIAIFSFAPKADWVEGIFFWSIWTLIIMAFSLPVCVSNSDHYGPRIRRKIPAKLWQRAFLFPFYNGAASGLLWVVGITVITLIVTKLAPAFFMVAFPTGFSSAADISEFLRSISIVAVYAFAYGLLALFLHRKFLPKRPPKVAGVIILTLIALGALVPNIILFFFNRLSWNTVEGLQIGNLFNVFSLRETGLLKYHQFFAGGFLLAMILLNLGWFVRQIKNFRPAPPEAPPVLE
jgi:hypothetical protein